MFRSIVRKCACLGLLLCLTSVCQAQFSQGLSLDGDNPGDAFGFTVHTALRSHAADDIPDIVVGARLADLSGQDSGGAFMFSGVDGSLILQFNGQSAGDLFGSAIGSADIDANGYDEVLIGAPGFDGAGNNVGRIYIFNLFGAGTIEGAASGDQFGTAVVGLGDVNGDGQDDYAVGAIGSDSNGIDAGEVQVISGSTGLPLYIVAGSAAGDNFGRHLANIGDLNLDGVDDFTAAATKSDFTGVDAGSVQVVSGIDGSILFTVHGQAAGDRFGQSLSGAGDVDFDGIVDFVIGADLADFNGTDSGSVYVFSGLNGSLIHVFHGAAPGDRFGASANATADLNHDGKSDLVVGAPESALNGAKSGQIYVYSGYEGTEMDSIAGSQAGDQFGTSLDVLPGGGGDFLADIVVGASGADSNGIDSGNVSTFNGFSPFMNSTQFNGSNPNDFLGGAVAGAGDVNGDGFDDYIAGARGDNTNGNDAGSATVISGFDHSVLYVFHGDTSDSWFGWAVDGAGDVNGDGFDDLIVGALHDATMGPGTGMFRIFSGLDGQVLLTKHGVAPVFNLGSSVSALGDLDQDGFDDFVVGARSTGTNGPQSGSAHVYSGSTGTVMFTFNGGSAFAQFGSSVSCAGDVNGDGVNDIVVGAPTDNSTSLFRAGRVRIYSGVDGSIIQTLFGNAAQGKFGLSVDGVGDVNRDGFDDIIVGSPSNQNVGLFAGNARVFSGADGSILHNIKGSPGIQLGNSVAGTGDVNGDGSPDYLVGTSLFGALQGQAILFSGADKSELVIFAGESLGTGFGSAVDSAGDINGDGFPDLIIGARHESVTAPLSGSAHVFISPTKPSLLYSTATRGQQYLSLEWHPENQNPNALLGFIVCGGANAGGLGLIGGSFGAQDALLFGYIPILLDTNPNMVFVQALFNYDSAGELRTLVDRQNPVLAGVNLYLQCYQLSPLVLSSNGLRLTVAP
ncbi:MAG: hypothetical protein ACI97A_002656 [Planctomycetota bacterium]|jgi:hypothetical protein